MSVDGNVHDSGEVNPYASPVATDAAEKEIDQLPEGRIISFSGTYNREDLMLSLADAAPARGNLVGNVLLAIICCFVLILSIREDNTPMMVFFLSLFSLPFWLKFVQACSGSMRARKKRINSMVDSQKATTGWMDRDRIVLTDQNSMMRANWNFFGSIVVFPDAITLGFATDMQRRFVFPKRFFHSAQDFHDFRAFLYQKFGAVGIEKPNLEKDLALVGFDDTPHMVDSQEALNWNAEVWPFPSNVEGECQSEIQLSRLLDQAKHSALVVLGIFIAIAWYFLPVWVGAVYFMTGAFDQSLDFGTRLMYIAAGFGPAVLGAIFVVWQWIDHRRRIKSVVTEPLKIIIRDAGIMLKHTHFDSWFTWEETSKVLLAPQSAGWELAASKEQNVFPDRCFSSPEAFKEFARSLKRNAPADIIDVKTA